MEIIKKVKHCYHNCYFFGIDGGPGGAMYCNHLSLDHKNYGGYIITQDNSRNRVPDKCPLRIEDTKIIITLERTE